MRAKTMRLYRLIQHWLEGVDDTELHGMLGKAMIFQKIGAAAPSSTPEERFTPHARREILSEWNADHLLKGSLLDVGGDLLLLLRLA